MAASRRTDRNMKARMESALMASEIHKRRTGKRLHITEDIVMGDAPYEEEQDGWSRPRTCSVVPKSNMSMGVGGVSKESPASAVLAKTEEEWRDNEINRLFAEAFPNFGKQSQPLVPTMPQKERPLREPACQNTEGSSQQQLHEHLQKSSPPPKPDQPASDTSPKPGEDSLESLLGETPSLCDSHATTLTSCSPSFMPDLPSGVGLPPELFDPNGTGGLYFNDYTTIGEAFSFKADDLTHDGDVNEWLQHVCDSGDMLEMPGWDSQLVDEAMDDWWLMPIDDSAQLATSVLQ